MNKSCRDFVLQHLRVFWFA